jgi:hypothetical protein
MTAVREGIAVLVLMLSAVSLASAGQRADSFRVDPLTATISGRVTSDTGGPLRRAEVRAISESGLTRFATTDTEGRYLVRDLPAGTFTLHVSKTGFVPLYFGQNRPFEQRTTIRLAQGQRFAADVRLPRAGVITGRIFDRAGEPVLGVRVQALRRRVVNGTPGLQAAGTADTTDDTGAYRLYGLPPGEYYVTATPRLIEDRPGRIIPAAVPGRGVPIFYPGTANRGEAQRIPVTLGVEARADLQLLDVRTSRVTGTILTSAGTPAPGAMVSLLSRDLDVGVNGPGGDAMIPLQIQTDAAADGTFELTGVPPGSFVLRAQTRVDLSRSLLEVQSRLNPPVAGGFAVQAMESALIPVSVEGDISGLAVTTSRGGTIDIVIVADDSATTPLPERVRVTLRSPDLGTESMTMNNSRTNQGTMALQLAVPSRVSVEGLPENWALARVLLDAEDVTDKPVDLKNRANATLRVVLTDRVTQLIGSVVASASFGDAGSTKAIPSTVVVFADDETKWAYPSRFVRTARADNQNAFQVTALPPNLDYRAIAVDFLEDGEEADPEFLKRMRERGTRFSLRDGERRSVELRLIHR